MKLRKLILLLGVLGLLAASAPPPAGALSMITLRPGTYQGHYELAILSMTSAKVSNEGGSVSTIQIYKLTAEGTIDITITASNQGMAVPQPPDAMSIYQDHTVDVHAKDFDCHELSAMNADATSSPLAPLTRNNFNPDGPAFNYPFSISNITSGTYRGGGGSSKCNYPVSQEVLRKWIDEISAAVNRQGSLNFGVSEATDAKLSGGVWVPGWNSTVPGPTGMVMQDSGGQWYAFRVTRKSTGNSKGWRK